MDRGICGILGDIVTDCARAVDVCRCLWCVASSAVILPHTMRIYLLFTWTWNLILPREQLRSIPITCAVSVSAELPVFGIQSSESLHPFSKSKRPLTAGRGEWGGLYQFLLRDP